MFSFKSIKSLNNYWLFGIALLSSLGLVLAYAAYIKSTQAPPVAAKHLHGNLWIAEQIKLEAIPGLERQGYTTIIDLRPDGEATDQASSQEVAAAAHANQLKFSYVPVPHGDIPDKAVQALELALADQLANKLANKPGNVLLYCRSGKRAARTWSLLEASRPGGLDVQEILAAVKNSGQSADDLEAAISTRIKNRKKPDGADNNG